MNRRWISGGLIAVTLLALFIASLDFDFKKVPSLSERKEIQWDLLAGLNYQTGEAPSDLEAIHDTYVRIPGYIVPLSDEIEVIREFLLVPNAQACIHVPPPPPNLIVHVVMDRALTRREVFNPSWVEGKFRIETTRSKYGAAGYRMEGDKVERYRWED